MERHRRNWAIRCHHELGPISIGHCCRHIVKVGKTGIHLAGIISKCTCYFIRRLSSYLLSSNSPLNFLLPQSTKITYLLSQRPLLTISFRSPPPSVTFPPASLLSCHLSSCLCPLMSSSLLFLSSPVNFPPVSVLSCHLPSISVLSCHLSSCICPLLSLSSCFCLLLSLSSCFCPLLSP